MLTRPSEVRLHRFAETLDTLDDHVVRCIAEVQAHRVAHDAIDPERRTRHEGDLAARGKREQRFRVDFLWDSRPQEQTAVGARPGAAVRHKTLERLDHEIASPG